MSEFETGTEKEVSLTIEETLRGYGRVAISRLRYVAAVFNEGMAFDLTASQQDLLAHGPLTMHDVRDQGY